MLTTKDLQGSLGLTRRQLRHRLDALAAVGLVGAHNERTGPHNRKEYEFGVLETLKQLEALHRQGGQHLEDCALELATKIRGNGHSNENGQGQSHGQGVQLDEHLVAEGMAALVEQLRQENAFLRSQLDRLTQVIAQPALPGRTRQPWWAWWPLRRRING